MIEELLLKLSSGVDSSYIDDSNRELVDRLIKLNSINIRDGIYKLDTKYSFGIVDISRDGKGYLTPISSSKVTKRDMVIDSFDLNSASKGDIVLAKRYFRRGKRVKARVIEVLKRRFQTSVVYLKNIDNNIVGINIKTGIPIPIGASQKSLKKFPPKTVLKIENSTSIIEEVLGVLDDPKVDEKISLAIYNKKEEFSKEARDEAKSYGDFVDKSLYPDRVDLTHLPFCTIDPPTAKDFDDAIYFDVDNSTLYVAIADVSEYVNEHSYIDKEAQTRGFSIYFPHKSIPMLPRALSENICSLKPSVDRLAFLYKLKLDQNGIEVLEEELIEAVISSKRRYTYDKIDLFLSGDMSQKDMVDETVLEYLLPLNKILKSFRKKRLQNGCEFRSHDFTMKLDQQQNLIETIEEEETPSHALIEDAMLLANKAAAKALDVGIFRVHQEPSLQRVEELLDDLSTIGVYSDNSDNIYDLIRSLQSSADKKGVRDDVDQLIIRAQKQAIYSDKNSGHFGLGFSEYTHFTSPIRRYSDLIVHRILKAKKRADREFKKYITKDLEIKAEKISELEREAAKVAWDYMDRKYARWAHDNIGKVVSTKIVKSEKESIARVSEGPLNGARVFLIDSEERELFESIKVEILSSDIASTKIIGTITYKEVLDV